MTSPCFQMIKKNLLRIIKDFSLPLLSLIQSVSKFCWHHLQEVSMIQLLLPILQPLPWFRLQIISLPPKQRFLFSSCLPISYTKSTLKAAARVKHLKIKTSAFYSFAQNLSMPSHFTYGKSQNSYSGLKGSMWSASPSYLLISCLTTTLPLPPLSRTS
jgi:hypothetical protein